MKTHGRDPFEAFEKFAVGSAAIGLVLVTIAYFAIPTFTFLTPEWCTFLQNVIANLVPTLLVFILAYALLYRQIQKLRSERETEQQAKNIADEVTTCIRKTIASLKDVIPSAEFAWFYDGGRILDLESESKADEIWIVSPHLLNDTGTSFEATPGPASTIATVQKNLRRRINYTFIVPDTDRIKALLPQLEKNYEGFQGQCHTIRLEPGIFECLAVSEIVIYNPRMEGRQPPRVFLELPVVVPHEYWVELADDVAYPLLARVQKIVDENTK